MINYEEISNEYLNLLIDSIAESNKSTSKRFD